MPEKSSGTCTSADPCLEYVYALTPTYSHCMPMLQTGKCEGPRTRAVFFKRDADCDLRQVVHGCIGCI